MTLLKFAHLTTGAAAVCAMSIGWGTWWFAAGMLVGCVSLILDGLDRYIDSIPEEPAWTSTDDDDMRAHWDTTVFGAPE